MSKALQNECRKKRKEEKRKRKEAPQPSAKKNSKRIED